MKRTQIVRSDDEFYHDHYREYNPKPIETDAVELPAEVGELVERLSASVHDTWAVGKIANGYRYGEVTSDEAKTHADLIPYSRLAEDKKEYDRNTVLAAIKGVYALGYKIEQNGPRELPRLGRERYCMEPERYEDV